MKSGSEWPSKKDGRRNLLQRKSVCPSCYFSFLPVPGQYQIVRLQSKHPPGAACLSGNSCPDQKLLQHQPTFVRHESSSRPPELLSIAFRLPTLKIGHHKLCAAEIRLPGVLISLRKSNNRQFCGRRVLSFNISIQLFTGISPSLLSVFSFHGALWARPLPPHSPPAGEERLFLLPEGRRPSLRRSSGSD